MMSKERKEGLKEKRGGGGEGGCNRRHVDAAAAAAGCASPEMVEKWPKRGEKSPKQPQKLTHTEKCVDVRRLVGVLVHFINELRAVSG